MPFINSNHDNALLYYRDYVPATSPPPFQPASPLTTPSTPKLPLIFSSAWPFSSHMYDHLLLPLIESHRHRCILPDRRGFGRSEWSGTNTLAAQTINYDVLAADLAQVIDTALPPSSPTTSPASSDPGFIGIGASMGCGELLLSLSLHPSLLARCRGLIFLGSALPIPLRTEARPHGPPRSFWDNLLSDLRGQGRLKRFEGVVEFIFRPDLGNRLDEAEKAKYVSMAKETDYVAMERTVQAFLERDLTDVIQGLGDKGREFPPVLILHGDRDEVNPVDEGPGLVRKWLGEEKVVVKVYENGAHGLAQTHREECLKDLLTFLNETVGSAER